MSDKIVNLSGDKYKQSNNENNENTEQSEVGHLLERALTVDFESLILVGTTKDDVVMYASTGIKDVTSILGAMELSKQHILINHGINEYDE